MTVLDYRCQQAVKVEDESGNRFCIHVDKIFYWNTATVTLTESQLTIVHIKFEEGGRFKLEGKAAEQFIEDMDSIYGR